MDAAATLSDRRQRASDLLGSIGHTDTAACDVLRALAAQCLGLTASNRPDIAVNSDQLPPTAAIIGEMTTELGDDVIAVHFDLTAAPDGKPVSRVSNTQAQDANAVVQQHAGEPRTPLLIFTLPDDSGIQFIYGDPTPGRPNRLLSVSRLTWRRGELNRTTLDALEQIGQRIATGRDAAQNILRDGFNVQPVTDAFFRHYKAAYDAATNELKAQPGATDATADSVAQTLFNRLLFVHFVSKKGWLTFNGSHNYLNALWTDYQGNPAQTNFYADRLDALFHEGMNTPQPLRDPDIAKIIGNVPYLNGGLFERTAIDRQNIRIADHIIEALLGHDGLFNSYNFTVMEATPLDTEVAVDPEMLGKLFEETVNARHSNGAYYTPRPVVAFMCREALKGCLFGQGIAGLTGELITELVDRGNADAVTMEQAIAIAQAVHRVKALDPACGSGAFLLGMMQEIMAVNSALFRAGVTPESLYRQKLNIIGGSLYGVDQDANAVSIAMLRLWLSLAVDYDGDGTPPTLPNLDLKLVAGDALAGPDPQNAQGDFMAQTINSSRLGELARAYTAVKTPAVKEHLREYITSVKTDIRAQYRDAAPAGVVEWRVDFADVNQAGGFDIVIANPPYVRDEEIKPQEYKSSLVKAYSDACTNGSDLYCYFYARALQLLRPGGMHVFVCSNSWLDVQYGARLQEYLLDNASLDAIYESAVERQFSTAAINTIISVAHKGTPDDDHATRFVQLRRPFEAATVASDEDHHAKRIIIKPADELRAAGTDPAKRKPANRRGNGGHSGYVGDKWGGKYLRAPEIYHHILDKYGHKLVHLGDIATIRRGVTTGANKFFFVKSDTIERFGIEDQFLAPAMKSPTESRSIIVNPATLPYRIFLCHKDKDELKGSGALAYIEWAEKKHAYHTRPSTKGRRHWYDLGERTPPHIAVNRITDARTRAFRSDGYTHFGDTLYELHCDGNLAEGIAKGLNSDFAQVQYNIEGRTNFGGGALELKAYEVEKVLIPDPAQVDITGGGGGGFTESERQALEAALRELVNNRRLRAKSA